MSSRAPLRWGVLGAARIARKLVPAIRSAGGEVVALGASSRERAESAARELGIPEAFAGYEPVVAHPSVEAIYLPLANRQHREWLLRTAEAGKDCLCEKPLTLSERDAREARESFSRAGRHLEEAFMWRHHPQISWLRDQFAEGRLGVPLRMHASFSFPLQRPEDYRWSARMGGGVLWDIGCYGVDAARYFFGEEPVAASFHAVFGEGDDAVDESAFGWLDFGEARGATISCSFRSAFAQGVEIVGSEGRAWIKRPWLAVDTKARVVIERGMDSEIREFEPCNAYRHMVEHFTACARDTQARRWPAEDGVAQARAMEGVLRSAHASGEATRYVPS